MVKKGIGLLLACLLVSGLIYGVTWIGDAPVSAEISQEAKGQFVRVEDGGKKLVASYEGTEKTYPIADNVWVYRNSQKAGISDLQQGDTLEIILNSKSQAAYIKAASAAEAAAPASAPASAGAAEAQQPAANAAGTGQTGAEPPSGPATAAPSAPVPAPAPAAQANTQSAAPGKAAAAGDWPWTRLSLELKNRELMLKVKHELTDKGTEADIYVQTKDRAVVHMNGAEAEQMLRLLTTGLPTDRAAWEKALKARLAAEFKLKDASPDWKLDIRWKDDVKQVVVPAASQSPHSDAKTKEPDKEKEKDNGKGKDKKKDEEKGKGKGKGHDEDHDD